MPTLGSYVIVPVPYSLHPPTSVRCPSSAGVAYERKSRPVVWTDERDLYVFESSFLGSGLEDFLTGRPSSKPFFRTNVRSPLWRSVPSDCAPLPGSSVLVGSDLPSSRGPIAPPVPCSMGGSGLKVPTGRGRSTRWSKRMRVW